MRTTALSGRFLKNSKSGLSLKQVTLNAPVLSPSSTERYGLSLLDVFAVTLRTSSTLVKGTLVRDASAFRSRTVIRAGESAIRGFVANPGRVWKPNPSSRSGFAPSRMLGRIVPPARLHLHEPLLRQNVRRQVSAHDAGGVEPQRPFEPVDLRARRMTVDHKGRSVPEIGPEGTFRVIGPLARPPFRVDHLHPCDHRCRLLLPRLAGEKSAVNEDGVQLADFVGQQHRLEVSPVLGAQLREGGLVVFLQKIP